MAVKKKCIKDEDKAAEQNTAEEKEKQLSLEEAFEQLDRVIEGLEDKEVSLEDSFKLYHEGIELLKQCNASIDRVEKELIVLEENGIGE